MANTKVSALTADGSPTTDDLIYTVNDPGGTPASRKVTLANLITLIASNLPADTIDAITEIASALKTGSDTTLVTGTAGTTNQFAVWDANGDIVGNSGSAIDTAVLS